MATAAFDRLAQTYDATWTHTTVGRLQRQAVWRHIDPLFPPGSRILDLGCGTGEDALHLASGGVHVTALDASSEMVHIARRRGVEARVLAIENLDAIDETFDGVLSNFGALNCAPLPTALPRLIRPGGHLALCLIGRFCLWETLHLRHATRRWSGASHSQSLNLTISYPTVNQIQRALAPAFLPLKTAGIGLAVPPSYIKTLSPWLLEFLAAIDRRLAHRRFFRALADHRLLIFQRQ
jgi:ubiquinone/menaquinone biosynthesis C-methylase UbiE